MSAVLLDTCAVLWLAGDQAKLSSAAHAAMKAASDGLYVSSISAWEIALAASKGRIELRLQPEQWFEQAIRRYSLQVLDISWQLGMRSVALPAIHADPCDRLIIATAQERNMPIVTADTVLPRYPDVRIIW